MSTIPILPSTPRRGTQRASHLRHVSNGSSETMYSRPMTTAASDTGAVQHDPVSIKPIIERRCNIWVHDEGFSKDEVVLNMDLFPDVNSGELMAIVALKTDSGFRDFQDKAQTSRTNGEGGTPMSQSDRVHLNPKSPVQALGSVVNHDVDNAKRYLFIAKDMSKETKAKHPSLEISVAKHVADVFSLKHRSNVLVSTVDSAFSSASHVELCFKDEYLARSDMWRLSVGELSNKTVFRGQKILFMGTVKAHMSKEMWDFDSEGSGEIMFTKVVNGFLPALFKKWAALKAKHLVSIVLFTRVEYDTGLTSELGTSVLDSEYHTGIQIDGNKKPYKDFYRVVVSEMASGSWTTILYQLKREFKFFRKDISMHRIDLVKGLGPQPEKSENGRRGTLGTRIEAEPSLAMYGNVLEAINLASSQFSHDYIDRDLMRTGISIVVITPSPGLFEVDYETLRTTTETLIGNGIGIDLVCLPKMPLHSVPLFRYRNPQYASFQEALHFKSLRSEDSTPRQSAALYGSSFSSLTGSLSPTKASLPERILRSGSVVAVEPPSEWSYAIPHWIDVSFWTGASQDHFLSNASTKGVKKYLLKFKTHRAIDFAIRCKMYEMEMASVMENAMNEISVTPLQHDSLFPQMILPPREMPALSVENKEEPHSSDWITRPKIYTSLVEVAGGPSKPLIDRESSQEDRSFFKTLNRFDLSRSEIQGEIPGNRQRSEGKKMFKTGSEEGARRVLADDPKVFGTSFSDDRTTPKGVSFMQTAMSGRSKSDARGLDDPIQPRKESINSSLTMKAHVKPPKLGRQISLGKHGFGIAAPKAVAAEIQTEHVSAAKPSAGNSKASEMQKSRTSTMANHLLNPDNTHWQERPSSSLSEKSKKSETGQQESSKYGGLEKVEIPQIPSARPIAIKNALQSNEPTGQFTPRSVLGSHYEGHDRPADPEGSHILQSIRPDDGQKLFNSKLLAGSVPELPTTLSPTTALSPWLNVLNPSNPAANDTIGPSQYRRWQHVFPRPVHTKAMKWKSLSSPASVPLTTESFPSKYQLDTEYQQKPYNISQNADDELNEHPKTREEFLRELVGLRLSHGFQIVVGSAIGEAFGQKSMRIANVFDHDRIADDGASIFMTMGNTIHQLSCVNGTEVEVNMFVRKPTASTHSESVTSAVYKPAIRTTLAEQYESRKMLLGKQRNEYNWNYVDTFIAGFEEEMSESLRFWRARFVLIPVERPTQSQRRHGEDNEEEVRLEGIKRLTQMWQRHRILSASERRFQSLASRKSKDPNPLDIVYKTDDPSVVVTAELDTLPLVDGDGPPRRGQLLESERFRKSKLDIGRLAEVIQAPVDKGGVRMQNRRWHFRLHYNCFIGSDMTTWLIENFEDIETREEAVELGNILMTKDELQRQREKEQIRDNGKDKEKDTGIFVHVEKRHPFRDGQYFYQVTGEFAKQRPESRSGWFTTKRRDMSVPPTPMSETRDSPLPERSRSGSNYDEKSSDSGTATPMTAGGGQKKPKVALSKVMKYDVDHRKRSYRPERINLHYDRLHNPDNCYHIRIDWMGVTAKLIEDAIESWATTAERYGLRLVEAPIGEASIITSIHPFRSPYIISLAAQPPEQQPRTYFDVNSFAPQVQTSPASRLYYQKAIMKKFNFVLDIEAAQNFPSNVDVTYSWGRPDFKYTQYIHRSGVILAQITDDGDFLLLANRLFNNRTAAAREMDRYVKSDHAERGSRMASAGHSIASDKPSPYSSPMIRPITTNQICSPILRATSDVLGPSLAGSKLATAITPETIKNELETFCRNATVLESFYKEVYEKATPPSATPPSLRSPYAGSLLDANIPTLGLPPGVLTRDNSPSPMRLSNVPGVGNSVPQLGRRQSVQMGLPLIADGQRSDNTNSPRGSITQTDEKTL
ncbi:Vacuolar membrane-associated iml1 [Hyphodiscus hymeniophilus]|uniref:Vacuolar membrane-associated protein IML1 n=1 Tax=Hyphodiscus hymeniophilus TaxID=353542 RepID=A0A9P7B121_9HELO|nr:Vacuolar membrane-associated iml1 [Hyphodiscus hymeniophilus]